MKATFISIFLFLSLQVFSQTTYYKGGWSRGTTSFFYKSLLKLTINGDHAEGEIIWQLVSADSLDKEGFADYKRKTGLKGIEMFRGRFDPKTNDLNIEGIDKMDPDTLIGVDKYTLKLSPDKKIIYGKTNANGHDNGCFYALKVETTAAAKEFEAVKKKLKRKGNTGAK